MISHKELTLKACKWLKKHEQNLLIPNCKTIISEITSAVKTGEIPDVIGWCSWASVLIEVKTNRNDFLVDFKKPFRQNPEKGMGEFRYYLCPENLILEKDLPLNWGLLYFNKQGDVDIIKTAKEQKTNLASERTLLLSHLRRSLN